MDQDQDLNIRELLTKWGYDQKIIDTFEEQGIETNQLSMLSEYSLEKIFTKIGERTRFMQKIKDNLYTQETSVLCPEGSAAPPIKKKRQSLESVSSYDSANTASASTISTTTNKTLELDELLSSTDGKMILSFYETEHRLDDYYRLKLADEIVRKELRHDIQKSFPNSLITYWSEMIVGYFKSEYYEVWAGCTKGKNRDSSAGRGILLNRYYNMRRKLIKVGAIAKSKNTNETSFEKTSDIDEEQDDLVCWLQNTKTVNLVLENWERTTVTRMAMLKGEMEIHKYMDNFPALKCSDGYRLLEMDFENLYPAAAKQLYKQWPALSCFIMSKIPDKEQKNINDCCTPDGKQVKTLRSLTLLFPIRNVIMKKKQQWRPSKLETKDSIFTYVKSVADIQTSLVRKKEKFYDLGIHLGPQLFAVTPDEDKINECYLTVNDVMYNVGGPLKAFDIFFTSFHALNSCYAKETEREMYFLQQAIYSVHCDTDKNIRDSKTVGLIKEFDTFKSTQA